MFCLWEAEARIRGASRRAQAEFCCEAARHKPRRHRATHAAPLCLLGGREQVLPTSKLYMKYTRPISGKYTAAHNSTNVPTCGACWHVVACISMDIYSVYLRCQYRCLFVCSVMIFTCCIEIVYSTQVFRMIDR